MRELSGTSGACFSVLLLLRQNILCTRLCVPDSRHGARNGSLKTSCVHLIPQNSQNGVSRHADSSTTTNGQNHGPVWKTQSFLLNEICTVILCRTVIGEAICENPVEIRLGESFQIGNVSLYIEKKDYSYLCVWMKSN